MPRRPGPKKGPPRKANNACVETWVDREILATLGSYFHKLNPPPRSMSELVRMSLIELADILVQNGLAIKVDDPVEATQALSRIKAGAINRSGRGLSTYLKLQQKGELGAADPYFEIRKKAQSSEAMVDAEMYEGMVQYHMSQGLTKEEAERKVDPAHAEAEALPKRDFEEGFEEKEATKLAKLKDALSQGPDQSTIITEEE